MDQDRARKRPESMQIAVWIAQFLGGIGSFLRAVAELGHWS
jgi:hypothetical protein